MSNPLRTPADYEFFVYSLQKLFPTIRRSTVRLVRRGASLARIVGELHFDQNVRLVVRERIVYHRLPAVIDEYGYEVWQGNEKLYWYDSQPHPNAPDLQSTHPHHKHIPPVSNTTVSQHPTCISPNPISQHSFRKSKRRY